MPERIDHGHEWVGAVTVVLPLAAVRMAHKRGSMRVAREQRVDVQEVYCRKCMRPYGHVGSQPCEAVASRTHLIGGPVQTAPRRLPGRQERTA